MKNLGQDLLGIKTWSDSRPDPSDFVGINCDSLQSFGLVFFAPLWENVRAGHGTYRDYGPYGLTGHSYLGTPPLEFRDRDMGNVLAGGGDGAGGGTTRAVRFPRIPEIDVGTFVPCFFAWTLWFKLFGANSGVDETLVAFCNTTSPFTGVSISYDAGNQAAGTSNVLAVNYNSVTATGAGKNVRNLNDGQWHLVCSLASEGTGTTAGIITQCVYIDGLIDAIWSENTAFGGSPLPGPTTEDMFLAGDNQGDPPFAGQMCDFRIYDGRRLGGGNASAWGDALNKSLWNPETRWELYSQPRRLWFFSKPPSGGTAYALSALAGSYAETGVSSTLKSARYLIGTAGSYAETASASTLKTAWHLVSAAGSYAETGAGATPLHARFMVGAAGSYAVSGSASSPVHGRLMAAAGGSYAETAASATLQSARNLVGTAGSYAETGSGATLKTAWHLVSTAGTYAETGSSSTPVHGHPMTGATGTYTETGASSTPVQGRYLSGSVGSYAETGSGATLQSARHLLAALATYAETGSSATIVWSHAGSYTLSAATGSYAETGIAATLQSARHLVALVGAYVETGQGATLKTTRHLAAATGSYAETGSPATLLWSHSGVYTLSAATGSYAETGVAATLQSGHHLIALIGSYAETGAAVTFHYGRSMVAATGTYAETGTDAAFQKALHLAAATGIYAETGLDATFHVGIPPSPGPYPDPFLATSTPQETLADWITDPRLIPWHSPSPEPDPATAIPANSVMLVELGDRSGWVVQVIPENDPRDGLDWSTVIGYAITTLPYPDPTKATSAILTAGTTTSTTPATTITNVLPSWFGTWFGPWFHVAVFGTATQLTIRTTWSGSWLGSWFGSWLGIWFQTAVPTNATSFPDPWVATSTPEETLADWIADPLLIPWRAPAPEPDPATAIPANSVMLVELADRSGWVVQVIPENDPRDGLDWGTVVGYAITTLPYPDPTKATSTTKTS